MNLQFFEYDNLHPNLQAVSKDIYTVALKMINELPEGAEKSAGLRKLLEAKDCFVRAVIERPVRDAPGPENGVGFSILYKTVESLKDNSTGEECVRCKVFLNSNSAIIGDFLHRYPIGEKANVNDIPRLVAEQADHIMYELHKI